jgi:hypothetical protein
MHDLPSRSNRLQREQKAEEIVAELFAKAGWAVRRPSDRPPHADLLVRRGKSSYVVDVMAAHEGRADRMIPLWSQACLQATRAAGHRHMPLAVVAAPTVGPRAASQVLAFAEKCGGEHVGVGVVDFAGFRRFRGPHLEGLDSAPESSAHVSVRMRKDAADLFSDLNQWLIKVLLAPEVPDHFLAAPRGQYHNASQLARAANVSVMSASRFVRELERHGHLHESRNSIRLVRRDDLFRRWQAVVMARAAKEVPMRFVLRRDPRVELNQMLSSGRACLGRFAAADAFGPGVRRRCPTARLRAAIQCREHRGLEEHRTL